MAAFRTEWDTEPNPTFDVWTTTNGGEILPGILSPFTATMYNRFDERSLRRLMKEYPSGRTVTIEKPPIGNFFGICAGRLVLNVGFSVAAMSSLDGEIAAAMAAQFFQGSDEANRLIVDATPRQRKAAYAVATCQRDEAPATLAADMERLYADRAAGEAAADRVLSLKAAWKRFTGLIDETLAMLNRHYVVSIAAGEFQVRLAGLIAAGGGDPTVIVGLCSGLGEVESSKPAIALWELGQVAAAHGVESAEFAAGLDTFLQRYGFRVQGEADPMNPDWSERREFVLSQVRSMMAVPAAESPQAQITRAMAERTALEDAVHAALSPELRPMFAPALAAAQHFTRLRELSKAVWVLGTRRMRPPLLAVGDGLAAAGRLRSPDDLRWCTYAEVETMAKGGTVDGLAPAITRRRAQWTKAHDYTLPDAFVGTTKPVRRAAVTDVRALTGMPVSRGTATGTARVILSTEAAYAREIEPGEVLVAPFTDTPWTPLFIPAAAVVVETGGVLSHAATVAREFGIPAVVLVHDATRLIRDGDTISVDGSTGVIEILARAAVPT